MINRICKQCGKKFKAKLSRIKNNRGKFCSKKCYTLYQKGQNLGKNNPNWKGGFIKKCEICKKTFWVMPSMIKNNEGKFCSQKCMGLSMRKKIIRKCIICGKRFETTPCRIKKNGGNYCSCKCSTFYFSGNQKGKNNPNWKDGATPRNILLKNGKQWKVWREKVYKRDNFTCQKCGDNKSGKLNPHHIFNFAQFLNFRFELFNGITFCEKCHRLFHHLYGIQNNNKEQVNEFLKLKM